jgi:hypothetical protein
MTNITSNPPLKSMAQCLDTAVQDGHTENFKATNRALKSLETNKEYRADQIHVVNFSRSEGPNDPADNSILYIGETDDGAKGTLVNSYDAYADPNVGKFITEVPSI